MITDELKARKALYGNRVRRIRLCGAAPEKPPIFAVQSANRSRFYIVIPGYYCSCPDFLFSVVLRRVKEKCYHMIAAEMALESEFKVEEECWPPLRLVEELLRSVGGHI